MGRDSLFADGTEPCRSFPDAPRTCDGNVYQGYHGGFESPVLGFAVPTDWKSLRYARHVANPPDPAIGNASLFGDGLIGAHQAGMIVMTFVVLVLLFAFFRYTRVGLAMRAAAANPESARLVGIRVGMMTGLGWGMASCSSRAGSRPPAGRGG